MDTTELYIKMCEQSWPDLKAYRIYLSRKLRMLYALERKVVFWRDSVNTSNYDRGFPLWEQDQLQEMLRDVERLNTSIHNITLAYNFARFCGIDDEDSEGSSNIYIRKGSMEQLWLSFVMHEKYGKVWDGEQWRLISENL